MSLRVLLSDGSSLASRQIAQQLGQGGHAVGVVSADPLCLTRFTRHVRWMHPVPAYGLDPFAWLESTLTIASRERYDVLFPTQEQVAILARCPDQVASSGVATVVPSFDALARVQDKLSASATLSRVVLAQPESTIVRSASALRSWDRFPVSSSCRSGPRLPVYGMWATEID